MAKLFSRQVHRLIYHRLSPGSDSPLSLDVQVGARIYKIHRYFFERESEFFRDLFSLPQGDSTAEAAEGKDDDHPIKIMGATVTEFDSLLRFFYFGMHSDYKPTIDDWLSILSISTRFIFDKVREKAIAEITARLNDLDPFELIAGAEKYNIDQWLMPAYRRIVLRSALVSEREALNIPLSTSIMLMRSRERFWKQYYHYQYSDTYDGTISHPEVDPIIDEQIRAMRSSKIQ
ncbi:hypothetical protein BC834DRAFT_835270 [Gloeopeniophorella convolvens]|nr:hypothetical protein BC834DRAFT_835270 [Gloeopeniophorella convolvens]